MFCEIDVKISLKNFAAICKIFGTKMASICHRPAAAPDPGLVAHHPGSHRDQGARTESRPKLSVRHVAGRIKDDK